jgi:hypothetical protein
MPFMEWQRVVKNCSDHLRVQLARRGRVLTAVFCRSKKANGRDKRDEDEP